MAHSNSQIQHMTQFILHEAREKADEVMVKAQQDYTMEKQRVVEDEKLKIRKEFERRERGMSSQSKIDTAKELNKCKISVLQNQSDEIDACVKMACSKLETISSDTGSYTQLLVGLIKQGITKLSNESVILVRCREQDKSTVQNAISQVSVAEVQISVMPEALPAIFEGEKCTGGVLMMNESGKIKVNNTFNARLAIAAEHLLPELKNQLFGGKDYVTRLKI